MLFDGLQDLVRIQFQVTHDLPEHVPFHLCERKADVLVGEQRVLAPASLVEGPVDYSFSRLGHLVLRNIEILHGRLQERVTRRLSKPADSLLNLGSKRKATEHDRRDGAESLKKERKEPGMVHASAQRASSSPAPGGACHPLVKGVALTGAYPTPPRSARMRASVGG